MGVNKNSIEVGKYSSTLWEDIIPEKLVVYVYNVSKLWATTFAYLLPIT